MLLISNYLKNKCLKCKFIGFQSPRDLIQSSCHPRIASLSKSLNCIPNNAITYLKGGNRKPISMLILFSLPKTKIQRVASNAFN